MIIDTTTSFKVAVEQVKARLLGLPMPTAQKLYDYEPAIMSDIFPAVTLQLAGHTYGVEGSDNPWLPPAITLTWRVYYPVIDSTEIDGLKRAQEQTLAVFSEWLEALNAEPDLAGDVAFTRAEAGRIVGVQEGGTTLYAYETDVQVVLH